MQTQLSYLQAKRRYLDFLFSLAYQGKPTEVDFNTEYAEIIAKPVTVKMNKKNWYFVVMLENNKLIAKPTMIWNKKLSLVITPEDYGEWVEKYKIYYIGLGLTMIKE